MDAESIVEALERYTGEFPRAALEQAISQRDAITPSLLDALQYARKHASDLPEDYMLHTWAMYLLAQFREKRAYPLIIELFDLPSKSLERVHGETITGGANRILASVCGGDVSLIEQLIERPEADEYVRDAAVGALVSLVAAGQRSREETLEYFRGLFRTATAEPYSFLWSGLVLRACDLYPNLVLTEIQEAYDKELVDPFFISLSDVNETLDRGKDATLAELAANVHYRLVEDTIRDTEWWACFQPDVLPPLMPAAQREEPLPAPLQIDPAWLPGQKQQPVSVERKPGRNDRCPCGSGRKYKVCCLKQNPV